MLDHLHGQHDVETFARVRQRLRGGERDNRWRVPGSRGRAVFPGCDVAPRPDRRRSTAAPSRASGSLNIPAPQPMSRMRNPASASIPLPSRAKCRHAVSLMNPSRTGLNLCSDPILPRGSHHSCASAEKRATSSGSTVERGSIWAREVISFLIEELLTAPFLA